MNKTEIILNKLNAYIEKEYGLEYAIAEINHDSDTMAIIDYPKNVFISISGFVKNLDDELRQPKYKTVFFRPMLTGGKKDD